MKTVTVRGLTLGAGKPKICVPIVAQNMEELCGQAKELAGLTFDLVEWRADWYQTLAGEGSIAAGLQCLRELIGNKPVLFTIRTRAEGGQIQPQTEDYIALNRQALAAGADLIDVEQAFGEQVIRKLVSAAHAAGAFVVGSSHDFAATPAPGELERRLSFMSAAGCDIAKIAVMPRTKADVLTLLTVTERMSRVLECPLITMSMAAEGVISRLCGEVFGSCLTFGAAQKASAPGQIGTEELAAVLEIIHNALA